MKKSFKCRTKRIISGILSFFILCTNISMASFADSGGNSPIRYFENGQELDSSNEAIVHAGIDLDVSPDAFGITAMYGEMPIPVSVDAVTGADWDGLDTVSNLTEDRTVSVTYKASYEDDGQKNSCSAVKTFLPKEVKFYRGTSRLVRADEPEYLDVALGDCVDTNTVLAEVTATFDGQSLPVEVTGMTYTGNVNEPEKSSQGDAAVPGDKWQVTYSVSGQDSIGEFTDTLVVDYVVAAQTGAGRVEKYTIDGDAGMPERVEVKQFSTEMIDGAVPTNSGYVWTPVTNAPGHMFSYRVNFDASITGDHLAEGALQIRVPAHLLKDKSGRYADQTDVSVPLKDISHGGTTDDTETDTEYAYYADGDEIVVFNCKPLPSVSGYFEIGYTTALETWDYQDMGKQEDFTATISISAKDGGASAGSMTQGPVIDTHAVIETTLKKYPTLFGSWQDSWGTKPADADDYYYLIWEIVTEIEDPVTQSYSLEFVDDIAGGGASVAGFKLSGRAGYQEGNTQEGLTAKGKRYDYVLTRHEKTAFDTGTYTCTNKITVVLTPADGVDPATQAVSARTFSWTKPTFERPTGHFYSWKYGNENWKRSYYITGEYARYDLDEFQEGFIDTLDSIPYEVWSYGYPYPWTLDGSADDPASYGKKAVTYVVKDDTLYPMPDDTTELMTEEFTAPPSMPALSAEDYDFEYLTYSFYALDAAPMDDGLTVAGFQTSSHPLNDQDILTFSVKSGDTWIEDAAAFNLGTGEKKINSDLITNVTGSRVDFAPGVDGYKISFSNAYYYSDIRIVPRVKLYKTQRVLEWTGQGDTETGTAKNLVLLANVADHAVYDSEGTQIYTLSKVIKDRIRRTQRDSFLKKEVISTSNNVRKKLYVIGWKVTESETVIASEGEKEYIPQAGGVFYDVLPAGANLDLDSVQVMAGRNYLPANAFEAETISDYKDTGRTLLKVTVKDPGDCYTLYYSTAHSWDDISDYGKDVYNPVAYETGNDRITGGYPDNGGVGSDKEGNTAHYFDDPAEEAIMTGLDPAGTGNRFLYASEGHWISALTAASTGLYKKVKGAEEESYGYESEVDINGLYSYRIRFANSFVNQASNLVFYDDLENYTYTDEDGTIKGDWNGTLQKVDVSNLAAKGIDAKVYISTSHVDFSGFTADNLPDLSGWQPVTENTDLSQARAVAIDARYGLDGGRYVLAQGESLQATLYMKAPAGVAGTWDHYPVTYNNIYLQNTLLDDMGGSGTFFIHQDYTAVYFKVAADIKLHKVSALNENQPIRDISFKLSGTSDYGTRVDEILTTDRSGCLTFKAVEQGTYILQEYECTPDWLEDHTEHSVAVTPEGKVLFDGEEADRITITNEPRIHADLKIRKTDLMNEEQVIPGTTFKLEGTSAYGTDYLMVQTTDAMGALIFSDLEKGHYTLTEIKPGEGYIDTQAQYEVVVDDTGNVEVRGLESVFGWVKDDADLTGTFRYAVSIYGIGQDEDENGEMMGLTFGPATVNDYSGSYKAHIVDDFCGDIADTDAGTTDNDNPYRCLHWDSWDTIISWNNDDPEVYRKCLENGCTKAIILTPNTTLFNTNFEPNYRGDGPSVLYYELLKEDNEQHLMWNPLNGNRDDHDRKHGTNKGGWGASRIRAMLNGSDSLTMAGINYASELNSLDVTVPTMAATEYTVENSLFSCFPKELQSAIGKKAVKYTADYTKCYKNNTPDDILITYDKLWLFSTNELSNNGFYPYEADELYDKFFDKDENASRKNRTGYRINRKTGSLDGEGTSWWTRSVYTDSANASLIYSDGALGGSLACYGFYGIAPGFALSRNTVTTTTKNKNGYWLVPNEPFHEMAFLKYDNEGLAVQGAEFTLSGTSEYNHPYEQTSVSDATGKVTFSGLEPGTYALMETSVDNAVQIGGASDIHYELDSAKHVVTVDHSGNIKLDGKLIYTYEGMEDPAPKLINTQKNDKKITLYKKWVDDETDRPSIVLHLATGKPLTSFSVIHNGNGGMFESSTPTNTVLYGLAPVPSVAYSHTPNLTDDGTGSNGYGNNRNLNDVVTIPGAAKLEITLTYQTESTSYDWVCIWEGNHPEYTAAGNYSSSITGGKIGGNSKVTATYTVNGDTATFGFRSDSSSDNYYGYYAIIKGLDANGNPVDTGKKALQPLSGDPSKVPTKAGYDFTGWYIDKACTVPFDPSYVYADDELEGNTINVYAGWEYNPTIMKYAVSIYGIGVDMDENGDLMGLTFGPATGANYINSYKAHITEEESEQGQRCIHWDSWETIIENNRTDPTVYQACLDNGCTKAVPLVANELFNENFAPSYTGDGPSMLYYELMKDGNYQHLEWNPLNGDRDYYDRKYGTNKDGWGASRIRAMLNGSDSLTMTGTDYGSNVTGNYLPTMAATDYNEDNSLLSCFPEELQAAIGKRAVKYTADYKKYNANNTPADVLVSYDKLWLFSTNELLTSPSTYYNLPNEANGVYEKLAGNNNVNANRIGYRVNNSIGGSSGSSYSWWLRSPFGSGSNYVSIVNSDGSLSNSVAYNDYGVAPGFALSR